MKEEVREKVCLALRKTASILKAIAVEKTVVVKTAAERPYIDLRELRDAANKRLR